ncbi:MAG TPA: hypothetical protein VMR62_00800 [Bryobacteraceae bacterium]|jgi:hypothetical protein|nr:hypothetical protein [Bryobacteraceae bacterium]
MLPAWRTPTAPHTGKSGRSGPEDRRGAVASATRYSVPDVCVMLAEPDEEVFTEPPF